MKLLFIFSLLFSAHSSTQDKATSIPDGSYIVRHFSGSDDYNLQLNKGSYRLTAKEITNAGKVIWNKDGYFVADLWTKARAATLKKADTANLGFVLAKSFGHSQMELGRKSGDTIFFRMTYSANLHITKARGYLLRTH